ncbi:MAG: hypothetical protein ABSB73_12985 [Solirubrobacteraceae bacterium]|jgi:hypothetical protein
MSVTLTVTVSDADQPRLQAALAAAGITDPGAAVVARLVQIVQQYEAGQEAATAIGVYESTVAAFTAGYSPIVPAATITPGP